MKVIFPITSIACILILASSLQSCQNVVKAKKKAEEITSDLFEYSLNSLGDRLFVLIPEGDTKANLRVMYDDFVQRAVNGDVEQDQIEYVAANILNATNRQDKIQPDLAKAIVEATASSFHFNPSVEKEALSPKTQLSLDQARSLGENLNRILKMNDELKTKYHKANPNLDFAKEVFYKFDKGIVMTLDEKMKSTLAENEFEELFVELKEMEKVQKMEWKEELSKSLKLEQQAFRKEMEKVKELKLNLKGLDKFKELELFSVDDSNYFAPYVPDILLDSIMQDLSESLEELEGVHKIIIQN